MNGLNFIRLFFVVVAVDWTFCDFVMECKLELEPWAVVVMFVVVDFFSPIITYHMIHARQRNYDFQMVLLHTRAFHISKIWLHTFMYIYNKHKWPGHVCSLIHGIFILHVKYIKLYYVHCVCVLHMSRITCKIWIRFSFSIWFIYWSWSKYVCLYVRIPSCNVRSAQTQHNEYT